MIGNKHPTLGLDIVPSTTITECLKQRKISSDEFPNVAYVFYVVLF